MIAVYHNRDLDGFTSGAIVKKKYPEAKLIGWDYSEPLPDFEQFKGEDVIMIDITFKIDKIRELEKIVKSLTIIDHHIGFVRDFNREYGNNTPPFNEENLHYGNETITYRYINGVAACEIGWKHLFPDEPVPYAVTLLGRYDTWRQKEGDWEEETLPFQMGMRLKCNSVESFPILAFDNGGWMGFVDEVLEKGVAILEYQRMENEKYAKGAFEKEIDGLRVICLNTTMFSSQAFDSIWDEDKYDLMMPFRYMHGLWKASLYTTKEIDCSLIAKARGGGGHKKAAGFEVANFEDLFK